MSGPVIVSCRESNRCGAAVVFLHGGGGRQGSWGRFPQYLQTEPALATWDIFNVGYPSHLFRAYPAWWKADPAIATLALWVASMVTRAPLSRYRSLAFVTHSLGGLIVQRALVDNAHLVSKVSHFVQFGVSSLGFDRLWLDRLMKHCNEITRGSPFIEDLRARWDEQFGRRPQSFKFLSVAGNEDMWVPRESSIDLFDPECVAVVNGGHSDIIRPGAPSDENVQLVIAFLTHGAAPTGPLNSARVAVQYRESQNVIARLLPQVALLDEKGLVELALALDVVGRRQEAIEVLQGEKGDRLDALGVLAGRQKRQWWDSRVEQHAKAALSFYREGLDRALASTPPRFDQAAYHGINVAFMLLGYRNDRLGASEMAVQVLSYCTSEKPDIWELATRAEAKLQLAATSESLDIYRKIVMSEPRPWMLRSMRDQAMRVAVSRDDFKALAGLHEIFGRISCDDSSDV
jgi:pimeloyl-ACP methyl ester carboxylesterase